MKRLLFIFIALVTLSSCMDDGSGMGQQYQLVASFQYPGLKFDSDSTFLNRNDAVGFGFDALNFFHELDADKIWFDGGFILSCLEIPKSGKTDGLRNTYRANVPVGQPQGNTYTVFYQNPNPQLMPEKHVEFAFDENGTCLMIGCYVTNTVEVADSIRNNFKLGDKLTIKATGYLKGAKTDEADFTLAEYSAQKDSIVSIWTGFDLAKLGSVDQVTFEVNSTNPNVPAYFCMDNMVAKINIQY